jgi:hypothetical protein
MGITDFEIASRQRGADENRRKELELPKVAPPIPASILIQWNQVSLLALYCDARLVNRPKALALRPSGAFGSWPEKWMRSLACATDSDRFTRA